MAPTTLLLASLAGSALAFPTKNDRRWDNGLAQTPPMGWNSYNHYSCAVNESIIMSNAKALVDFGLADLGYNYATTDCGWTIPHRTDNGTLTWNETLFPSGFPALGEYIHGLGLKFGVYSDSGIQMCMTGGVNQTGSLFYEQTDANTFSAWGADLLKYDNCYSEASLGYPNVDYMPDEPLAPRFNTMKQALVATGRSILFQICEWGLDFPSAWAPALGNTWRVTNDITPVWSTIYRIVNQVVPQTSYGGPHQWLDLDMLEVGNNIFTTPEEQTHFSLWAILKSPLTIGAGLNDTIATIAPSSLEILKNRDAIAFNQDSLGVSANLTRRWSDAGYDVWSGPLSNNRTVVALVNWNNSTLNATLDLPDIGLQRAGYVKDIWNNSTSKNVETSFTKTIAAHGTLLLELGNTQPAGYYPITESCRRNGNKVVVSNIYGLTTSKSYSLSLAFKNSHRNTQPFKVTIHSSASSTPITHTITPSDASSSTIQIPLSAGSKNTLTITTSGHSAPKLTSLTITAPSGKFYPATAFTTTGFANHVDCTAYSPELCAPVGAKISNIAPNGTATISVPSDSTGGSERFVEVVYINNEVATDTAWTNGRNARNITVRVNDGPVARLEVPLSGHSSELFSPMRGWGDSATLGLLVSGWSSGQGAGQDVVVVGNEGGENGVQAYGADFVGLRVL